jgi:hypothetical protein
MQEIPPAPETLLHPGTQATLPRIFKWIFSYERKNRGLRDDQVFVSFERDFHGRAAEENGVITNARLNGQKPRFTARDLPRLIIQLGGCRDRCAGSGSDYPPTLHRLRINRTRRQIKADVTAVFTLFRLNEHAVAHDDQSLSAVQIPIQSPKELAQCYPVIRLGSRGERVHLELGANTKPGIAPRLHKLRLTQAPKLPTKGGRMEKLREVSRRPYSFFLDEELVERARQEVGESDVVRSIEAALAAAIDYKIWLHEVERGERDVLA